MILNELDNTIKDTISERINELKININKIEKNIYSRVAEFDSIFDEISVFNLILVY